MVQRNRRIGYLFLLPNFIGFVVLMFIPIIMSFLISFTDWDGFNAPNFVFFDNYIQMFQDSSFLIALWNTFFYTILFVPIALFLALMAALALNTGLHGMKFYRTAFFMPYITSTIAIAVVWQMIFHPTMGPLNQFLMSLGVNDPPKWLASSEWAMTAVVIVSVWKNMGYYMVIFLAALQGVPREQYEAASLDGANGLQKFLHVTVPSISPMIFFNVIIATINSFKVFDLIYTMTAGGPGRSTNVLVYRIYTEAFKNYHFGYVHSMDDHKRREMDKMDDLFAMPMELSVERQPYPVLLRLTPEGCTAHLPDFPKLQIAAPTMDAAVLAAQQQIEKALRQYRYPPAPTKQNQVVVPENCMLVLLSAG